MEKLKEGIANFAGGWNDSSERVALLAATAMMPALFLCQPHALAPSRSSCRPASLPLFPRPRLCSTADQLKLEEMIGKAMATVKK